MESNRKHSVSELRSVFAKSQLSASTKSSQESLDLTNQLANDKNETEQENSSTGSPKSNFERNVSGTRSLPKPTISPKPNSVNTMSGSKPGIKNLVAALEGSHGMYTTRNISRKHGITVKNLRESSEKHKSPEKSDLVTTKLLKKETIIFEQDSQSTKSSSNLSTPLTNAMECDLSVKENLDNNGNKVQHDFNAQVTLNKNRVTPEINTQVTEKSSPVLSVSSSVSLEKCDQENNVIRENVINADNYVCKSRRDYVLRYVPSKEELGPAPAKPPRPPGMRLPLRETSNNDNSSSSVQSSSGDSLPPQLPERNQNVSPKPPARLPPKPPRSLPKAPESTPPPSESDTPDCLPEEEEEIYNDVIFHSGPSSPSSPLEDGFISPDEDIYDDHSPHYIHPSLPRHPPPAPPTSDQLQCSETLLCTGLPNTSNDSSDNDTDAIYEEASFGPEYANTEDAEKEKIKKKKRALKTEQKTLEKIEKKREKFMKKFSLSGEEIPLDAGTVKNDSRGNKFDLNVVKGETVLILRMENNPSGKWLVKNGKGRVGYVELTNIQVDVESVKSVMVARTSQVILEDQAISLPIK